MIKAGAVRWWGWRAGTEQPLATRWRVGKWPLSVLVTITTNDRSDASCRPDSETHPCRFRRLRIFAGIAASCMLQTNVQATWLNSTMPLPLIELNERPWPPWTKCKYTSPRNFDQYPVNHISSISHVKLGAEWKISGGDPGSNKQVLFEHASPGSTS